MSISTRQRFWVVAIILCLSSIPLATHLWIQIFPPQGAVPTGVHTGDSAHHLVCMRAVRTHFHSPYATCRAEMGTQDGRYFANPLFLLYVVLGFLSHGIGMSDFLFLGLVNSIGGALYLWAVYYFLRRIAPQQAFHAFLLFVFGGGLGGLAYVYARGTGLYTSPNFESCFMRFASYELIEGQYIAPLLLMPRLYYTLPLAMGWAALTLFLRIEGDMHSRYKVWAGIGLLLLTASFLNLRLGPMFLLVVLLYMTIGSTHPIRNRLRHFAMLSAPVLLGMLLALGVLHQHPSYIKNVGDVAQGMMKVIPFLTTVFFSGCLAMFGVFSSVSKSFRTHAPSGVRIVRLCECLRPARFGLSGLLWQLVAGGRCSGSRSNVRLGFSGDTSRAPGRVSPACKIKASTQALFLHLDAHVAAAFLFPCDRCFWARGFSAFFTGTLYGLSGDSFVGHCGLRAYFPTCVGTSYCLCLRFAFWRGIDCRCQCIVSRAVGFFEWTGLLFVSALRTDDRCRCTVIGKPAQRDRFDTALVTYCLWRSGGAV